MSPGKKNAYRVVLHFSEPTEKEAGQRAFNVLIQGKKVLSSFDIVKEAGSTHTALVKEFSGITAENSITIELQSGDSGEPLLCAFEVIEEK